MKAFKLAIVAIAFSASSTFSAPLTQTTFCGDRYCTVSNAQQPQKVHQKIYNQHRLADNGVVFLPHPAGCPHRNFCACGASVRIFGRSIRPLWPSEAWLRMPRAIPAPQMVAARRGHVFVLESHIEGNNWLVSDYNSGGHLSRRHIRSIVGYKIVNPHGAFASN